MLLLLVASAVVKPYLCVTIVLLSCSVVTSSNLGSFIAFFTVYRLYKVAVLVRAEMREKKKNRIKE